MNNKCAVILAGGEGKRMKSDIPKPMNEVLGKPMLRWVIDAVKAAGIDDICVVTGFKTEVTEAYLDSLPFAVSHVLQSERLGTGHAVMMAKDFLNEKGGDVVILCGDAPFMDTETIAKEEMYDGFYGICTNLLPPSEKNPDGTEAMEILRINHMRWQIEDCFRELKTEFKSRPVYLSRENRIKAHFLLCSLSLILLKYLEKSLKDHGLTAFSTEKLLNQLRDMELVHLKGFGYIPASNPSPILSALQDIFRIPIGKEIITEKSMKKITAVSLKP